MKFHIKTYGCQMNERDSEAAAALMQAAGHVPAAGEDDADVLIVNTCSVRGKAEDKAIGKLWILAAGKKEKPGLKVGVIGCMVQRMQGELFRRVPTIDFAVGTRRLWALPAVVEKVSLAGGQILEAGEGDEDWEALNGHVRADNGVSAFVNILFGCNRRCAYCIVPSVRGSEWSRPPGSIIAEASRLVDSGIRDITLLGQSVMSYGRSNETWPDGSKSPRGFHEPFSRLLEAVSDIPGIGRVRFTSGHPSGCTEELTRAVGELPAVCEHLHLPLQSGSDRVLKLMRRGYTSDDYRRAVESLRGAKPGMSFTTDIIVGFPTETDEDFEMTRRIMEEIEFDNAFVFKYSPRPGTPAAEWKDDVPEKEKIRRNQVLLADVDIQGTRVRSRLEGQVLEVLVEGVSLRNDKCWAGRTRRNMTVIFDPTGKESVGSMAKVRITRVRPQTLYGDIE